LSRSDLACGLARPRRVIGEARPRSARPADRRHSSGVLGSIGVHGTLAAVVVGVGAVVGGLVAYEMGYNDHA
jgi:hypothetical protein